MKKTWHGGLVCNLNNDDSLKLDIDFTKLNCKTLLFNNDLDISA